LPVTRDTRGFILSIKGKLKVLSQLEFYLIAGSASDTKKSFTRRSNWQVNKASLENIDLYRKQARSFLAVDAIAIATFASFRVDKEAAGTSAND